MLQRISKYLTEQFVCSAPDIPDDECIDEATHIVNMVLDEVEGILDENTIVGAYEFMKTIKKEIKELAKGKG